MEAREFIRVTMEGPQWYRKKPVKVRAWPIPVGVTIQVHTREGTIEGYEGDYIIEGVEGELYPCGGDIFRKTYEEVE